MSNFESLIGALSRAAGLSLDWEPVSPVEIAIDDMPVVISLDRRSGSDSVVLYSPLGEVPQARELEVYRVLLEANVMWSATGDATLAVNSATREALLCYRSPLEGLEPDNFVAMVAAFVELARGWRDYVASSEDQAPPTSAPTGMIRA
jgi:hypothetical protein